MSILHDIFISYQWASKPLVEKIHEKLVETEYVVWRDDEQLTGSDLNEQLINGIQNSACIVCFITKKYSESENCKREISYASSLKKPLLIVMLENVSIKDLGSIGFIINPLTRFNFYKEDLKNLFKSECFKSFLNSIDLILEEQDENDDDDDE